MTATDSVPARPSFADMLAVYLKPRVLIVLFLGFSAGLPLALSGSTLLVWMREAGVDLGTIGLFALVGTPYTIKFLWAPVVDALDIPVLAHLLGRRRGWLVFSQLLLIALFLGFSAGLPLALSGSTLLVWMREAGVDLGTIGLFALVGTPYTIKFLWAPVVDALDIPVLAHLLGRRRGWLVFSQLLLIA